MDFHSRWEGIGIVAMIICHSVDSIGDLVVCDGDSAGPPGYGDSAGSIRISVRRWCTSDAHVRSK